MSKNPFDTVAGIINRQLEEPKKTEVLQEIREALAKPENEQAEKAPREKKQFVILVSDPDGKLPEDLELVGWVVQIPETESILSTDERIHKAAYDFNSSKRGRRNPVSTVGEALEAVSGKFFKEHKIAIKTKIPVAVVVTNNQIPTDQ